ncbi:MAG TPA: BamA/TamA family outer membrane protein [Bryobacteraceae bacterium]|nr:BamA/TamA family outer membrane protein [Bryobacteraceae bacterium]
MVFSQVCLAQGPALIGRRIAAIEYSPAGILHSSDLERIAVLKVGENLRAEDIGSTIDRLFATGRFADVVAEAEPSGEGVTIRFVGTAARFVGGVSVEGKVNDPPSRGEIVSTTRLQLGAPFFEEDLKRAMSRMDRLFSSNGLYEAKVTPEVGSPGEAQNVFITLRVDPGKRARYKMPIIRGETKLKESTIVRATGWRWPFIRKWRRVTSARTREGVQGILEKYQKQERLTTTATIGKLNYDPKERVVEPEVEINPGPKIKVQAVEAKVSKRVLRRYVPIFQERAVDNDLLVEGAKNLRDYFQSKGYYDVDVDFRTKPPANDEVVIEYVISQGQRYKLATLTLTGANYFREEDLRERMFMQAASFTLRNGRYSEAFRKKDEENIANLYKANGFRDVKVTSIVDRNGGKTGDVSVTVVVEEGPQWIVDSVTLNGIQQGDREVMEANLASLVGQPFSEVNMAADRSYILTQYYSQGYPQADLRASWQPTDTQHHVNIVYNITEGERQFVRDVLVSGLKTTKENLVAKRITLKAGDPLSPIEQSEIQRRFYDMGVFARVDTAVENPEGDTSHKHILYNFEEANRYTLALGFGAQIARFGQPSSSSLASPAGSTGFSPQASLNLSRLNFRGRGHTVSLRGIYSNLQKLGSISYLAPRYQDVEGRNLTVSLLYENSYNVRTFGSKRQEASVQLSQRISKATTVLGRLTYRRVNVNNVIIPVLLVPQLVQPVRLGMISGNIAQDRRDNPADARRGIFNTADIALATKYLGSERNFTRVLLRNATYHRVSRNTVLARQTQFGVIAPFSAPPGITEQQSVPLPERFFGGGADSLRAFPFNQAGPRDTGEAVVPGGPTSQPTGFPLGGNALLFNNVELRFPLLGSNVGGVLFHDMGNVYSRLADLSFRVRQRDLNDFNYMVHAVGFGIRYRTPIGPIRGDLAYSINPPSFLGFNGTPTELLQCDPSRPISELPSVCQSTRQRVSHFQFFFSIGQTF